jgi:hypothetical protein
MMVAGGLSIATASGASAAPVITTEFQESISSSDPVFSKWSNDDCPSSDDGDPFYYRTFDLTVSEPGTYAYYDIGYEDDVPGTIDIEVGFYQQGQFDPSAPDAGCINTIDDDGDVTFPSAGTYTLVLTTNDSENTGLGYWSLTGPGTTSINSSSAAVADNPIPPWVQAYGVHTSDATCEDGWKNSWQDWALGVTGGWVCTREIPSLG